MGSLRISFILSLIFILLSVYLYQLLDSKEQEFATLLEKINRIDRERSLAFNNFIIQDELTCSRISENIGVISQENINTSIASLIGNKAKVVMLIPEGSCNSCLESAMSEIIFFVRELNALNRDLIVITKAREIRETIAFFKQSGLFMKVYGVSSDEMFFNLDNKTTPIFFIVNPDMTCHKFFILNINNRPLNSLYFDHLLGSLH